MNRKSTCIYKGQYSLNQMRNYPKNGIVWTANTQQGGKLSQEQPILAMQNTLAPTADSGYDAVSH